MKQQQQQSEGEVDWGGTGEQLQWLNHGREDEEEEGGKKNKGKEEEEGDVVKGAKTTAGGEKRERCRCRRLPIHPRPRDGGSQVPVPRTTSSKRPFARCWSRADSWKGKTREEGRVLGGREGEVFHLPRTSCCGRGPREG